jgi:hypothetical protein
MVNVKKKSIIKWPKDWSMFYGKLTFRDRPFFLVLFVAENVFPISVYKYFEI